MKTQEQIVEMLGDKGTQVFDSFLGFYKEVLLDFVTFEYAKPLLNQDFVAKVETGEEEWTSIEPNRDNVLAPMRKYIEEYGWPKAQDHRGISAGRTIEKMRAWAWLLDDGDELFTKIRNAAYPQYGAPTLKVICEHLDWPVPEDAGLQRMMQGLPCVPDCEEGCGH